MSNNFDTAVLLDSATYVAGDATTSGAGYFGFGRATGTEYSSGVRILTGAGVPADTAPQGSLYLRSGTAQLYQNTDGAATWTQLGSISTGSITLTDNSANAFEFIEGATPYTRYVTTNGAERVRSDVQQDFGAAGDVDSGIHIRDNSTSAFNFWAGTGSAMSMLGFESTNGAEVLTSAVPTVGFTAAAGTQLRLTDNIAAALAIGSTGDLDMLTFVTTEGAETIVVAAAGGQRFNTSIPVRFGTAGTEVLFTPDGTDLLVTGTGAIEYANDFETRYGADADAAIEYQNAGNILNIRTNNITGAGALAGSSGVTISTGTRIVTDAAVGTASGTIAIGTGATDVTDAGGTGAGSGPLQFSTGNASSTAGALSGPSGAIGFVTGNSADDVSGTITFTTGTAGTTRGTIDINATTIDLSTQATSFSLIDNTASALAVSQGNSVYWSCTTTDGSERIQIGVPTAAASTVAPMVEVNGSDFSDRIVLVEWFQQRPAIAADIANNNASKVMELIGTNSTSALANYATGGGVSIATAGAVADQALIRGNTTGADNSQSPWTGTTWSTSDSLLFKANVRVVDTANLRIGAGMKLSLNAGATLLDSGTDADQAWFVYDNPGAGFGANSATNWTCHASIGGVDTDTDTTVAVSAANWRLVISVDSSRVCRFYLNGVLRHTTAALTAAAAFLPFVGIQQTAGAVARSLIVQRMGISKLYSA